MAITVHDWDSGTHGCMSMESIARRHEPPGRCRISRSDYDGSQPIVGGTTIPGTLYVMHGECRYTLSTRSGTSVPAQDSVMLRTGQYLEHPAGEFSLEITSPAGLTTVHAWPLPEAFWTR